MMSYLPFIDGYFDFQDPEEFVYEDDEELDASEDGFSCPQVNAKKIMHKIFE